MGSCRGDGMNKREAIQAMLDGEKVFKEYWVGEEGAYLSISEKGLIKDEKGQDVAINNFRNIGWQIYKESAKKVKMWQWIAKDDTEVFITQIFLLNLMRI